jgi:hypothetical protein
MMRLNQLLDVHRPQDQLLSVNGFEAGNRFRGVVVLVRAHSPSLWAKEQKPVKMLLIFSQLPGGTVHDAARRTIEVGLD